MTIKDTLIDRLILEDPGLIGCQRRNAWTREAGQLNVWSTVRGNALLALLGERVTIDTPAGFLGYWSYNGYILQFRGGPAQPHWMDDISLLWAVIAAYSPTRPKAQVILLNENQGDLSVEYLTIPKDVQDRQDTLGRVVVEGFMADPPSRIAKNTARAFRVCTGCPFRTRCNAQDLLDNATHDWSESYRRELAK